MEYTLFCSKFLNQLLLTLKVPEELQLYGLYVHYVVHICDFGMLRVKVYLYPKLFLYVKGTHFRSPLHQHSE